MSDTLQNITSKISSLLSEVNQIIKNKTIFLNSSELKEFEESVQKTVLELADNITASKLQQSLETEKLKSESSELVSSCPCKMKNMGKRKVNVHFSGGTSIEVESAYYCRKSRQHKANKKGFYPGFLQLGIYEQCTLTFISKTGLLATSCCSFEESRKLSSVLLGYGIEIKKIYSIAKNLSKRCELARDNGLFEFKESYSELIVTVSVDGGRIRIRKNKKGKKTDKKRSRFHTDWREPKLMTIYAVDVNGKKDSTFKPIIDGSISGPDSVFTLLIFYLRKLGVDNIKKLLFIADGAKWIWNRVSIIIEKLAFPPENFYTLLDYYHMAEHLGTITKLLKLKKKEADKWIRKVKKQFLEGNINKGIKLIKETTAWTRNKELRRERNYFLYHCKNGNLNYFNVKNENLPIGSGAIESAVRRVINQRLKGCGIFWKLENANAMIMLRSFYKADRWDMLMDMGVKGAKEIVKSYPQGSNH